MLEAEADAAGAGGSPGLAPPPYDPNAYAQQPGYDQNAYAQQPGYGQTPAYGQQPAYGQPTAAYGSPAAAVPAYGAAFSPPTYGQAGTVVAAGPAATGDFKGAVPPPVAAVPGVEYCTALYDYAPQAQGDLPIKAGDVIEVVQRTADANGWWTGRLNGQVGVFPGNYVQLR